MTLLRRDLGCGNRERASWIVGSSSSRASHCFCASDLVRKTFSVTESSSVSWRAEWCAHLPLPALLWGTLLSGPMTPISCAQKERWGENMSRNHNILVGQKGDASLQLTLSLRQAAAAAYRSASILFEAKPSSSILQGHSTVTVALYTKKTVQRHNLIRLYIDMTMSWQGIPLRLLFSPWHPPVPSSCIGWAGTGRWLPVSGRGCYSRGFWGLETPSGGLGSF